ncbi:MAG: hypothetical protein RIQ49_1980 [Pseudomonadota bacterium]|jgi:cell division protein ZapA|nr:cell division protein ZapA [Betaproteobacteria bacterium]
MTSTNDQQANPASSDAPADGTHTDAPPVSEARTKTAVHIRLLERDYRLAVHDDEKQALVDAAQKLDARMREIRDQGKIHAADRIAIMAALEASLESVKLSQASKRTNHVTDQQAIAQQADDETLLMRMQSLSQRLSDALT